MELGIHIVSFDYPDAPDSIAPTLARAAEAAEAAGAKTLSVMDHYFQMEQAAPAEQPMLEGYTALGFLAAHTATNASTGTDAFSGFEHLAVTR